MLGASELKTRTRRFSMNTFNFNRDFGMNADVDTSAQMKLRYPYKCLRMS